MKQIFQIILLLLIVVVIWSFPVIISFITGDWWLILLYWVWWIPALLFTGLIGAILKFIDEK